MHHCPPRVLWLCLCAAAAVSATAQPVFTAVTSFSELRDAAKQLSGAAVLQLAPGTYAVDGDTVVFSSPSVSILGRGARFICSSPTPVVIAFTAAGSYSVEGVEWSGCRCE